MKALLLKAVEALNTAVAGLEWYRDHCPDVVNSSDDEADEQIGSAIADLEAAIKKLEAKRPDCVEAGPGKGFCDQCAAGLHERCRYVVPVPVQETEAWKAGGPRDITDQPPSDPDVQRAKLIAESAQIFAEDTYHIGGRIYLNDLAWALKVLAAVAPLKDEGEAREAARPVRLVEGPAKEIGQALDGYKEHLDRPATSGKAQP